MSRQFVATTETALADLLAADLSGLDLVALMIDGVHFADHLCVVALGIGIDGTKHPLAVVEGIDREHHPWSGTCWPGCGTAAWTPPGRSWPARRRQGPARRGGAGVRPPGDRPLPTPQDPQRRRPSARPAAPPRSAKRMRQAYHADSALLAEAQLEALAEELDETHPGAAGSLREGLAETLTVLRLGVPPTLARTLRSTNASSR